MTESKQDEILFLDYIERAILATQPNVDKDDVKRLLKIIKERDEEIAYSKKVYTDLIKEQHDEIEFLHKARYRNFNAEHTFIMEERNAEIHKLKDAIKKGDEEIERLKEKIKRMVYFEVDEDSEFARESKERDMIKDGFGSEWSAYCAECGERTIQVVRPGKAQCSKCG